MIQPLSIPADEAQAIVKKFGKGPHGPSFTSEELEELKPFIDENNRLRFMGQWLNHPCEHLLYLLHPNFLDYFSKYNNAVGKALVALDRKIDSLRPVRYRLNGQPFSSGKGGRIWRSTTPRDVWDATKVDPHTNELTSEEVQQSFNAFVSFLGVAELVAAEQEAA